MTGKLARIICSGCALFAFVVSVSATCQELHQCFERFGYHFAHVGDLDKHPEKAVDILCQNPRIITDCYDLYSGCATYKNIAELAINKSVATKQINLLCENKGEYINAIRCIVDAIKSISQAELQRSSVCAQQALQSPGADRCMAVEKMMTCSLVVRETIHCTADVMVLLKSKGMQIPCYNIYKEVSSGSRLSTCSAILLPAFLVIILSKFV